MIFAYRPNITRSRRIGIVSLRRAGLRVAFPESKLNAAANVDRVVRTIAVDGCLLAEVEYAASSRVQYASFISPMLLVTLAGSATRPAVNGTAARPAPYCSFLPPDATLVVQASALGWRVLVAELHGRWAWEVLERLALHAPRGINGEWTQRLALRLHQELVNADTASAVAIHGLVALIAAEIARGDAPGRDATPYWLDSVRAFIELNYRSDIGVRELARKARVHPAHLSKSFGRAFGSTVREYVRRLRVEFARKQIESSGLTLSEIAIASGFADQSHFTKTFKRVVGTSPSEYRQTLHRETEVPDP
jgi:AraC family transcriptional regulator